MGLERRNFGGSSLGHVEHPIVLCCLTGTYLSHGNKPRLLQPHKPCWARTIVFVVTRCQKPRSLFFPTHSKGSVGMLIIFVIAIILFWNARRKTCSANRSEWGSIARPSTIQGEGIVIPSTVCVVIPAVQQYGIVMLPPVLQVGGTARNMADLQHQTGKRRRNWDTELAVRGPVWNIFVQPLKSTSWRDDWLNSMLCPGFLTT